MISSIADDALAKPASAPAADFDPLPYIHPELRPIVQPMLKTVRQSITAEMLPLVRKGMGVNPPPPQPQPEWREQRVPGYAGNPDVAVYVINAGQRTAPRPAILHMHGGGFILGDARSDIARLQKIAAALDCIIVTVDYRLAPETRFPGALEDNYAGLKWLYANASRLGGDPRRIAVMGESAGGGHAAMLAIAARDRGEVPLIYQALVYPMLDDRTGSTFRKPPWQGALMWTPESNRFGWSALLGVPAGSRKVPAGSVPGREANLAGLPATFIGVGSIDLFVDEDVDYARRLLNAGAMTELVLVPGGFHGFDQMEQTVVAQNYNRHFLEALRSGLSR